MPNMDRWPISLSISQYCRDLLGKVLSEEEISNDSYSTTTLTRTVHVACPCTQDNLPHVGHIKRPPIGKFIQQKAFQFGLVSRLMIWARFQTVCFTSSQRVIWCACP